VNPFFAPIGIAPRLCPASAPSYLARPSRNQIGRAGCRLWTTGRRSDKGDDAPPPNSSRRARKPGSSGEAVLVIVIEGLEIIARPAGRNQRGRAGCRLETVGCRSDPRPTASQYNGCACDGKSGTATKNSRLHSSARSGARNPNFVLVLVLVLDRLSGREGMPITITSTASLNAEHAHEKVNCPAKPRAHPGHPGIHHDAGSVRCFASVRRIDSVNRCRESIRAIDS
jgi:hypothetical protein